MQYAMINGAVLLHGLIKHLNGNLYNKRFCLSFDPVNTKQVTESQLIPFYICPCSHNIQFIFSHGQAFKIYYPLLPLKIGALFGTHINQSHGQLEKRSSLPFVAFPIEIPHYRSYYN